MALNAALRRGSAALVAATATADMAAQAFAEMDRRGSDRRTYLAGHQTLFESADRVRQELDHRVDSVIDAYAKSAEPPAWFRFGLGYPPRSDDYGQWQVPETPPAGSGQRRFVGTGNDQRSNSPSLTPPMNAIHSSRV